MSDAEIGNVDKIRDLREPTEVAHDGLQYWSLRLANLLCSAWDCFRSWG